MRRRPGQAMPHPGEFVRARTELAGRLRARREEIGEALLARVYAIADPGEAIDPDYLQGLKGALATALEYGLEAIEAGEERAPPIPIPLLAQARLAARSKVSLDTVLRRYFAGYTLLGEFIFQEAGELELPDPAPKRLLHAHSLAFDRLLAAVSEEHVREAGSSSRASAGRRRLRMVQRLLAGESVERGELRYSFEATHVGLLLTEPGATEAAREIAAATDRVLLAVRADPGIVWAWLGGTRPLEVEDVRRLAEARAPTEARIAVGESADGLAGWRLTHRQAAAALTVARCGPGSVVRYRDVALLAAALQDELLITSLTRLYLEPLERGRDGGKTASKTLRAYLDAGGNVSSAAAKLGVTRTTAASRLRAIEAALGCPLSSYVAELRIALDLRDAGA